MPIVIRSYALAVIAFLFDFAMPAEGKEVQRSDIEVAGSGIATQTGVASWYGGKWIGRLTANGDRYRADDLTAAHRNLAFGTLVRVTNLRNGVSTVVRINNRGPYAKGRIIDLSKRAATALAMVNAGTVKVRLEVLTGKEVTAAMAGEAKPPSEG